VIFGVLTAVAAYFLVRYMADSRIAGLLAMLFVSISAGNLARTTALVYRGDTFVSLFMVLSLVFMLKTFTEKAGGRRRYGWAALSAFFLSVGVVFWNGAPFMTMIYMLALVFVAVYGFMKLDREVLNANLLLAEFLFLAYFLEHVYGWLGLARTGLLLIDTSFFAFYVPILAACFGAWYVAKNPERFGALRYPRGRMLLVAGAIVAVLAVMAITFNYGAAALTNAIALTSSNAAQAAVGTANATNSTLSAAIGTTTQELQKASFNFLFTSFSMQLFLAPIGVALYVISRRRADPFVLAIGAYLLVASVLQVGQIRFNSLLSVPIAIFAAYGAYAIGQQLYNRVITDRVTKAIVVAALCLVLIVIAVFKIALNANWGGIAAAFGSLLTAPFSASTQIGMIIGLGIVGVEILLGLTVAYLVFSVFKPRLQLRYVFFGLIAAVILFNFYGAYATSITSTPADGVNIQFLTAMAWLNTHTTANSTVFTIWPDGSVVEAIGGRQSYTDSVGGENGTRIQLSSQYLFNTTGNAGFLYGIGKPDYIVSRGFWFNEIDGLAVEGLVSNVSDYGYQSFAGLNINRTANSTIYGFYSNQPPYYDAKFLVVTRPDGSRTAVAYMGQGGSDRYLQLSQVILYNSANFNYSVIKADSNSTLNYALLVTYSGNAITGGSLLGPKLMASNLFNLALMCNYYVCPLDNQNVTYRAVYINNDTRILKMTYAR
ncbi:MAG: hypothetical protein KGH66_03830, partial [Candidatus Micrarchaeota archaeon]|nr:hypothetical protein [Candidatus Micrarchaeota archaeon]